MGNLYGQPAGDAGKRRGIKKEQIFPTPFLFLFFSTLKYYSYSVMISWMVASISLVTAA